MSQTEKENQEKKEALKTLRKARGHSIKAAAAKLKEQNKIVKIIRGHLKNQPSTVPEMAAASGIPSAKIMWYVATMKKFGEVLEAEQDDCYFKYCLATGERDETAG